MPRTETEPLPTAADVAKYLNMSEGALAQLRFTGRGPKFIKLTGRQVRYRWSDVDQWIEEQVHIRT
jgi:predicted DNA-binding transcriptional regulator AlpA